MGLFMEERPVHQIEHSGVGCGSLKLQPLIASSRMCSSSTEAGQVSLAQLGCSSGQPLVPCRSSRVSSQYHQLAGSRLMFMAHNFIPGQQGQEQAGSCCWHTMKSSGLLSMHSSTIVHRWPTSPSAWFPPRAQNIALPRTTYLNMPHHIGHET